MDKNSMYKLILIIALAFTALTTQAQTPAPAPAANAAPPAKKPGAVKKIKIDYENETVMGVYDMPDAQFINSRRIIKFKELFNRRSNFIEEVEANKGLFNDYQK